MKYIILILALLLSNYALADAPGEYIGVVKTEWLSDGRNMRMLEDFSFVDEKDVKWDSPKNSIIDGASIPKIAWSIVGGPYAGKYREASVIHDVACDKKERPWQDAHKAFYDAMLTSGVDKSTAKQMYAAVYHFGPRWESNLSQTYSIGTSTEFIKDQFATKYSDSHMNVSFSMPASSTSNEVIALVHLNPKQIALPPEYFDRLKQKIINNDISLEEIRSFSP